MIPMFVLYLQCGRPFHVVFMHIHFDIMTDIHVDNRDGREVLKSSIFPWGVTNVRTLNNPSGSLMLQIQCCDFLWGQEIILAVIPQ